MAKVSFKEGSIGQKARSNIAERVKSGDIKSKADSPFGLATHIVKGMRPSRRQAVARR
jgi:hypothetical protein